MKLCDALQIPRGVTSVVGGGGKTSLIDRLCAELPGKVLRLTTTHCWPPSCPLAGDPAALRQAFATAQVAAAGEMGEDGKCGPPKGGLAAYFALADYVLIEADGSKGRPLKAPAEHEPALCGLESLVVAVAGASGMEQPIFGAAHRPELYAARLGKAIGDIPTPADVAFLLQSPLGQRKNVQTRFAAVLNQCDSPRRLALARECAALLRCPCVLTALKGDPTFLEAYRC